uniref:Uncharacterized protein n=1 Tax=Cyprinus carpio TaxID=7962 RepID=A0A8C1JV73_CYPCA
MKPRRHLTSVDLLPTIPELQESQSLDDHIDSIRELSQPTYPLSGPLRGSRLSPLRLARYPSMSLATLGSVLAHNSNQDPLDWLFAQALTDPEDVSPVILHRHTGEDLFIQKRMLSCCQAAFQILHNTAGLNHCNRHSKSTVKRLRTLSLHEVTGNVKITSFS